MREIKFRGKTATGDWVYGSLAYSDNIEPAVYFEAGKGSVKTFDFVYVKPETVGQFTGLKDKNWKMIFEGDVVFAGYGEYYQGQHEHSTTTIIDMVDYEALNALCNANIVQIIGNIHDNPELLKETK